MRATVMLARFGSSSPRSWSRSAALRAILGGSVLDRDRRAVALRELPRRLAADRTPDRAAARRRPAPGGEREHRRDQRGARARQALVLRRLRARLREGAGADAAGAPVRR